jgi:peptide/nickel transport system substrate-binding protein
MQWRPVRRAPARHASRRLTRRAFIVYYAVPVGAAGLLAACAPTAPAPPAAPAATQPPAAVQATQAPIVTPAPATAVAKPTEAAAAKPAEAAKPTAAAAAPTTAPATGKTEPKGQIVYAWHTTISPAWLDPQENPPQITPYNFAYALHDALVKHLPGKPFSPSLAESYEMASDSKSATFKLRQGIKVHDGKPVTPDDVKFTFEKYRGANAGILHDKTDRIEAPDERTVKFVFKEPFLDFMTIYGSPSSGAGWIVPKAYYEQVGPNGFKQKPIGAGPYKFVSQQAGTEIQFEAFTDYWRKTPNVKTIIMKGIPETATRLAGLQTGEFDVANQMSGDLIDAIRKDSKLRLAPLQAGTVWLEPNFFAEPDSPLKDIKVRQALSLAIDRKAFNDAEMGGLGAMEGNWIPSDWPGALKRDTPPTDIAQAKKLLADAGVANGFEVSQITPLGGYASFAERIASQLKGVGINTKVNVMERAAFYDALAPGPNRLKGFIIALSGSPGDAAARIRENALCKGAFSGICLPDVEQPMQKYEASSNPEERTKLLNDIQTYLLDNYLLIPILRQALLNVLGPRIANKAEDIEGAIPQYVYLGPYEDVEIKD